MFGPNAGPYLIQSINGLPRSGPNSGPYEICPVKSLPLSGPNHGPDQVRPLRGFGLNYGLYQIRPVDWTLCFWAHLLKAHLVIQPDISFVLLRAHLTFRPYINFGLLKARHIVGPNYGPVCIQPTRSRYLIGPNKDRDNFGLLKARDLICTIMGWGPFRAAAGS